MQLSIKYKLVLYMVTGTVLFVVILILSNTFLVEKFYLEQKKKALLENCDQVEAVIPASYTMDGLDANVFGIASDINFDEISISPNVMITVGYQNGVVLQMLENANVAMVSKSFVPLIEAQPSAYTSIDFSAITTSPFIHIGALSTSPFKIKDSKAIEVEKNASVVIDKTILSEIEKLDVFFEEKGADRDDISIKVIANDFNRVGFSEIAEYAKANTMRVTINKAEELYNILPDGNENSFFAIRNQSAGYYQTLCYQRTIDNGVTLLATMPMSVISEGVAITNQFITIVGILVLLFTIAWAFFISSKFTKPIMEISGITKKMKDLDFSQSIEVNGHDEISELSKSINTLSSKLDSTIGELNEKNKQLEKDIDIKLKVDNMRKDFISNVSHELKTPIFLIQGYAEGLKDNIMSDTEKKEFYCNVISEEADKMDSLVKDLLTISELSSDTLEIKESCFDISELINNLINKYDYIFSQKNIDISVDVDENILTSDGAFVFADKEKIEQVVTNLFNNAIDHISGEKQLKISISKEKSTGDLARDMKENTGDIIKVSVYNTGKNIPENSLDKIWDSFYKVDESHQRDVGGAGLGLSIVKATIDAHNQNYGVENHSGKHGDIEEGVEFWFCCETADHSKV